jgi:Tfp pilus assembly protein PilW
VGVWRDQRGFTLVDLLTACGLLGLALAGVVTIHERVLQRYVVGSNQTEVQQNARVVLDRMAREIRQSRAALTAATATSLTFVDQVTGSTTYLLDGARLTRRTANGDEFLIGGVQSLRFVYWDGASPPAQTVAAGNVRRVDITVQTGSEDNVVTGGVANTKAELATSVRLRNLS